MNTPEKLLDLLRRVQKHLYSTNPPSPPEFVSQLRVDVDIALIELKQFMAPKTPTSINLDPVADDEYIMPFGKFEGRPIGEVSASYLDWCRGQDWVKDKYPELWKYITEGTSSRAIDQDLRNSGKI